jgi:hypothetical protein
VAKGSAELNPHRAEAVGQYRARRCPVNPDTYRSTDNRRIWFAGTAFTRLANGKEKIVSAKALTTYYACTEQYSSYHFFLRFR